jgi:hypothetical protein
LNKPTLSPWIASVLTLMMAVLHTGNGVFAEPLPGPSTTAGAAMQANHSRSLSSSVNLPIGSGFSVLLPAADLHEFAPLRLPGRGAFHSEPASTS